MGKKGVSQKQTIKKVPVKKKTKKKIKIKYKNVFLFLLFLAFLSFVIWYVLHIPIRNIYVKGNVYLQDQDILEMLAIENYPAAIKTIAPMLEKKTKKEPMIKNITITHKNITELHIEIEENIPIFYDSSKQKTILKDGKKIDEKFLVPNLLNYIPDEKYKKFVQKIGKIDTKVLKRISEIKYDPNDKDAERFLMSMNDGNYVYVTLGYFERMDNYIDIMKQISKKFNNKKGILYLDSGGYFEVLEN